MCIEKEKKKKKNTNPEMSGGEPGNKKEYHGNYLNHSIPSEAK